MSGEARGFERSDVEKCDCSISTAVEWLHESVLCVMCVWRRESILWRCANRYLCETTIVWL